MDQFPQEVKLYWVTLNAGKMFTFEKIPNPNFQVPNFRKLMKSRFNRLFPDFEY